jgi:hypothetical protein
MGEPGWTMIEKSGVCYKGQLLGSPETECRQLTRLANRVFKILYTPEANVVYEALPWLDRSGLVLTGEHLVFTASLLHWLEQTCQGYNIGTCPP